jgi:dynein heavy chain
MLTSLPLSSPLHLSPSQWEAWLANTSEIVDTWLKVQAAWQYLEPIMGAEDITKQMPSEGTMFKVVDSNWHKLMSDVVNDTKVYSVSVIPHVLGILKEAQSLLDTIQTGLNQYLETKRLYFPRFYFLSNDELLEILSETKDPLKVQPHLKKAVRRGAGRGKEGGVPRSAMRAQEYSPSAMLTSFLSSLPLTCPVRGCS